VIKSELADIMNSFVSDDDKKWLIHWRYEQYKRLMAYMKALQKLEQMENMVEE